MRQWLGAGEMVIVKWPKDCGPGIFGPEWQNKIFWKLQDAAASYCVQIWMRGRSAKQLRKQSTESSVLYYRLYINGPEASVLHWYT